MADFRGFLINLDRDKRRLAKLQANLKSLALDPIYERVPAVDGQAAGFTGREGCYLSHVKVLERALKTDAAIIHVIEDDVVLSRHVEPFIRSDVAAALLERYDLLYLDMWVDPEQSGAYKDAFLAANPGKGYAGLSVLDLKNQRLGSTASCLLRREAISKVLFVLNAWRPLNKAIDVTLWDPLESTCRHASLSIL